MQERESATTPCTGVTHSKRPGGGVFDFLAHTCRQYIIRSNGLPWQVVVVVVLVLIMMFPRWLSGTYP